MKRKLRVGLIILFAALAVSSCSLLGVGTTMTDRVGLFVVDLNGSRTNIIDNIHPDAASYNTLDATYWNTGTWDPNSNLFSITDITEGSDSVTAIFNSKDFTNATIVLNMKDAGDFFSGENWKIMSCTINGTSQF